MLTVLAVLSLLAATHEDAVKMSQQPALRAMLSCTKVVDKAERLACFDREAASFSSKVDKGEVVVADREQVRAHERAAFGLPDSAASLFHDAAGAPVDQITGTVKSAASDRFGKWTITLSNDSSWQQIDDYTLAVAPRAGTRATVKRAAFGSFKIIVGSNAAIRVRRVR